MKQYGVAMETSENQGAQGDRSQSHQSDDVPSQPEASEEVPMETEPPDMSTVGVSDNKMEADEQETKKENILEASAAGPSSVPNPVSKNWCLPQRAALIKAVLSFLKKSIPDPLSIRNVMDGSLPLHQ